MVQFTLTWDNTPIVTNPNANFQRASYRERATGGGFISAGFTPTNDLPKEANTTDSPSDLLENKVYEFKVETICAANGPTMNDNGVQEVILMQCLTPEITPEIETVDIRIDVSDTDITKARFTLRRASTNDIVGTPITSTKGVLLANYIIAGFISLEADTNYYVQIELFSTVNNVEIGSTLADQIGSLCGPYAFKTDPQPICSPLTSVEVSSIEIP